MRDSGTRARVGKTQGSHCLRALAQRKGRAILVLLRRGEILRPEDIM